MTYTYIESTGVITVDTSEILDDVTTEFQDALGSDINTDSSSPEGRMIDAEAGARSAVAAALAEMANQINPNYAEGVFLDAIYALMGGERDQAEQSTVTCTLTGVSGTIVSAGSYVEDTEGQQWELVDETTIPSGGSVDASFRSVEYGAISADAGTITKISTAVVGWETVTNASAAVEGKEEQSDVSTRYQRKVEIGKNSRAGSYSVIAAVSALEGVGSLVYRENYNDVETVIDGVSIAAHSSYLCVYGGVDSEIAEAYYTAKAGCGGFTGTELSTYTDPNSLQDIPVKFARPDEISLTVSVTATVTSSSDAVADIQDAVIAYASGEVDGFDGFVVGADVSPFEMAAAINDQMAAAFVRSIEIGLSLGATSPGTFGIEIYQIATISSDNITVTLV
jgi:uncharacterized phage protein gp47/JayE